MTSRRGNEIDKGGRLISISDYLTGRTRSAPAGQSKPPPRSRAPLLFVVSLLVAGALPALISRPVNTAQIRNLPSEIRAALHRRTLEEISSVCGDASAATGQLREHCLSQARFLLSFPECNSACQTEVAAVLPHSRR